MSALTRLLGPRSVAIVGLSTQPDKHAGRVLGHLRRLGFDGEIWGVHPRTPAVEGAMMFPSVACLPGPPDVVVCAVPASSVVEVVDQAGAIGAGVVIVFAGGFAEVGEDGQRLQDHLKIAAPGVRILGPNSGGVIRPSKGLALSFLTFLDRPVEQIRTGPVGLVTQSGGIGSYLHNLAAARDGGLAVSVSTGNEADLGAADAMDLLVDDPEVEAMALVLETVRQGPEFLASLRKARRLGKPVVVCHLGRSQRGQRLMVTHTGALGGPTRVLEGVLDAEGATLVATPAELLDVAEAMARTRRPRGNRTAVVSHSGGLAILLSDLAAEAGVCLPTPSAGLARNLRSLLDLGAAANPIDLGGIISGPHRFAQAVEAFLTSEQYDMILAVSSAHPPAHTPIRAKDLIAAGAGKPLIHLWMAGDQSAEGLSALRAAGAAVVEEPRAAMAALAGLARLADLGDGSDEPDKVEVPLVSGTLSEHESKRLLGQLGIPVAEGDLARSSGEAVKLATAIGYPVVVKVSSAGIPHKTEIDGIRTGIEDEAGVIRAFEQVTTNGRNVEGVSIDGVRVERHRSGTEMMVGAVRDAVFGPVVLVGLGGIHGEALGDAAVAPAPVTTEQAMRVISRLKTRALLSSRRGPPPEIPSLAATVARVSLIFVSSDLEEIEINPLVWTGEGWEAVDALVRGHR